MLTLTHPSLLVDGLDFPFGLNAIVVDSQPTLLAKVGKEFILTAQLNGGFKVYVCPLRNGGVGIISAFFDDDDEPLVAMTPLHDGEDGERLREALLSPSLRVHLFDEHNREFLGHISALTISPGARGRLTSARPLELDISGSGAWFAEMQMWFGLRNVSDDADAIDISFGESLVPADLFIQDMRPELHGFHGSPGFSHTTLEREEPGLLQELDIIRLLHSFFPATQIYHGPLRITDREEIADVVVLTDDYALVVQAKDSPNIERILRNTIERKRKTTHSSLAKALRQFEGATKYLRSGDPVTMVLPNRNVEIELGERLVVGLLVLKEMFNDEYQEYTQAILTVSNRLGAPCIALDYPELVSYARFLRGEDAFFDAYWRVFTHGADTGMFPRLRMVPPSDNQ